MIACTAQRSACREIAARRGPFHASGAWWEAEGSRSRLEWGISLAIRRLPRLIFEAPDRLQFDGMCP